MYPTRHTSKLATYASTSTKGWWGLTAASQLWLSGYPKLRLQATLWGGAHESTYSPFQYTTMDPFPSPYENAIHSTHAYLAHFRVSTFTCLWTVVGNPEVLYRGHGYSNRSFITLQGCTSSYMFSPLSVCTRHVLGRLQAKADVGVDHDLPKHSSL